MICILLQEKLGERIFQIQSKQFSEIVIETLNDAKNKLHEQSRITAKANEELSESNVFVKFFDLLNRNV